MGFLASFISWATGKGWGGAAPPQMPGGSARLRWSAPPKAGSRELLELYERSLEFRTPVGLIASRFSAIPWGVVPEGVEFGNLEDADPAHPLQTVIDKPQPGEMSGTSQRRLEQVWIDILGESFFRIVQISRTEYEIYPLCPTWVTPRFSGGARTYDVQTSGGRQTYSDEEIVWLKHASAIDPYGRGQGKGIAGADDIQTAKYASDYNESFFYNGASPDRIIGLGTKDGAADPAVVDKLQADWNAKFRGPKKAHGEAFVGANLSVVELQTNFSDLSTCELRRYSYEMLRQLYGVPPELIGQLAASNRATIVEALAILSAMVLVPAANFRAEELNTKFLPRLDAMGMDVRGVQLGYADPTPADRQGRAAAMKEHPEAFTLNEKRELAHHTPRRGGDVYLREVDQWEPVDAGDVIEVTPIRSAKAMPPALPPTLSTDEPVIRLLSDSNEEVA